MNITFEVYPFSRIGRPIKDVYPSVTLLTVREDIAVVELANDLCSGATTLTYIGKAIGIPDDRELSIGDQGVSQNVE